MNAADVIDQLQRRGQSYRHWQRRSVGTENPQTGTAGPTATGVQDDGYLYVELTLPITARALVVSSNTMLQLMSVGLIPADGIAFRQDPNVCLAGHLDRFVLTQRVEPATPRGMTRSSTSVYDALVHPFVTSIDYVRQGNTVYVSGMHYRLSANPDTANPFAPDRIEWLGVTKPNDGTSYGVSYRYTPTWQVLDNNGAMPLLGDDALYLPVTVHCGRLLPVG